VSMNVWIPVTDSSDDDSEVSPGMEMKREREELILRVQCTAIGGRG
jgi:hypothetical protein